MNQYLTYQNPQTVTSSIVRDNRSGKCLEDPVGDSHCVSGRTVESRSALNGLRQYYRPPWTPALVWDLAPRPLGKTQMDDREVDEFDAPDGVEATTASDRDTALGSRKRSPIARFFSILGPGLVTGAADDDPSGIATYYQAGATYSNGCSGW